MYLDFWFFIYLGNGMNVKDLVMLKYKNIDGKFIRFIRSKTENTTRSNPQIISVYCSEELQSIIEGWGNAEKNPDNYIFPILSNGMDGYETRHKIQLFNKLINNYMYEIGAEIGIAQKLSTMAARHCFSTQLKRPGVNVEAIRELLGHHNLKTTMSYLDSFEDASKAEQVANLLPFRKVIQVANRALFNFYAKETQRPLHCFIRVWTSCLGSRGLIRKRFSRCRAASAGSRRFRVTA